MVVTDVVTMVILVSQDVVHLELHNCFSDVVFSERPDSVHH